MGKGEPVIILHGIFGMSDNWLSIAKKLSTMHRCYLLDLRNHGRSPHSQNLNYDDMVEDIYEFLTDFGLRTVSFIGHSMGGIVAMKFALEYSHRVEKLVVVDIAPKPYPSVHQNIVKGLKAIPVEKIKFRKEAGEILKRYVPSQKIRQFLLKNLYRKDDNTYAWRLNLDAIDDFIFNIDPGISQNLIFNKPTLFIRGGNSDYILPEDEQLISKIFSDVRIIKIPDASHWVHHEKPDEVIKILTNFL